MTKSAVFHLFEWATTARHADILSFKTQTPHHCSHALVVLAVESQLYLEWMVLLSTPARESKV
jgi:hypothetical protein